MSKQIDLHVKLAVGSLAILLPFGLAFAGTFALFGPKFQEAGARISDIEAIHRVLETTHAVAVERLQAARRLLAASTRPATADGVAADQRLIVDRAIEGLSTTGRDGLNLADDATVAAGLTRLRMGLDKARTEFDAAMAAPGGDLTPATLSRLIGGYSDAVETARATASRLSVRLGTRDGLVAPAAMTAVALDDLATATADLGLQLLPVFSGHTPLAARDRDAYVRQRERVVQLWRVALADLQLFGDTPAIVTARAQIAAHLVHDTFDVIDRSLDFGAATGDYRVSGRDLLDGVEPTAMLIDRLRTLPLDLADQQTHETMNQLLLLRFIALALIALALSATAAILTVVWRTVLAPLLEAGRKIRALARMQPVGDLASPTGTPEIAAVYEAIEDLYIVLEERAEHTQQLKVLAETDGLTGLMNRRLLDRIGQGDREFDGLSRSVSVILMDLDRFKSINDTYGHTSGDHVLRHAAQVIQRVCRKTDLVARYGGEEMAIVIFDQDRWVASHVAERVRSELEASEIRLQDGRMLGVTASFGVAHGRRGETQWLSVLNAADEALYRAKASGRNRVCSSDDPQSPPDRKAA